MKLVFFFLVFSFLALAEELPEIRVTLPQKQIEQGKIIQGLLQLKPRDFWTRDKLEIFKNLKLGDSLVLAQILKVEVELDKILMTFSGSFLNPIEKSELELEVFPETKMKLIFEEITVNLLKDPAQNYIILKGSFDSKQTRFWFAFFIVIFFLLSMFFLFWRKRKIENEKKDHNNWEDNFKHCQSREDFEHLYRNRQKLMSVVSNYALLSGFFQVLDEFQYKKNWSNKEFDLVRAKYEEIKDQLI